MGAQGVPQRRLVDALWPDEDGDAAVEAMQVSLYRLVRKLLGHADAIQLVDGMLSIDRTKVWVDLWCFEQHIAGPSVATDIGTAAVRVLSLYRGHLFEEDADVSWAITARERTRDRLLRFLLAAGCTLEAAEDVDAAAQLYRAGIDIDELAADLYQGLMRCLQSSGRTAQAVQVYRHLDQVLGNALGVTPSNLSEEIERGSFREDLYHRINVIPLNVPPLRERREDIPLLVAHFLKELARENVTPAKKFSPEALELLSAQPWPGNVRELKNFVWRMAILTAGSTIEAADLPLTAQGLTPEESGEGEFIDPFVQVPCFREARALFEKQFLRRKLEECRANVSLLAEKVGLERSHLYRKLKSYGLEPKKDGFLFYCQNFRIFYNFLR